MCCSHYTSNPPTQLYHKYAQSLAQRSFARSVIDAHSPRQPPVSPTSLAFSAPESYFTMHASYLIICSRFTHRVAVVTEKNGGQTDGQTQTHTHTHTHINPSPFLFLHKSHNTHTHRPTVNPRSRSASERGRAGQGSEPAVRRRVSAHARLCTRFLLIFSRHMRRSARELSTAFAADFGDWPRFYLFPIFMVRRCNLEIS